MNIHIQMLSHNIIFIFSGAPTPAPPCRDKIPSCSQYQKDACTDSKYRGWAEENCNKYCGFCSGGSGPGK